MTDKPLTADTSTKMMTLLLTPLQARVIRGAFLPANPNKLRPRNVEQPDGSYGPEQFDGLTLAQLAFLMIAELRNIGGE